MIVLYSIIIGICIILSAMFSSMDMAYSSVNRLKLKRHAAKGEKSAKRALYFVDNYEDTIASILFGNDFVNILASSIAAILGMLVFEENGWPTERATLAADLCLLVLLLIFGEIFPKELAKSHSFKLSKFFVPFLSVVRIVFFPFVYPTSKLAQAISSPLIEAAPEEEAVATDEELQAMVDQIEEEGLIDEDQKELLSRSIDFKETSCYEIMTPRVKVFAYDIETSFEEFLKDEEAFKHSRIPVYKENLDHIVGYIPVKTLLRKMVKEGNKVDINKILLPLISVPRTMTISFVMAMMKETHNHIVVVRDEFGGTEGILTLEDILEELVGEMWDETDIIAEDIEKTNKRNIYIVKGKMNISDFFSRVAMDDEELNEDYSTLSGWSNERVEKFARVGDRLKHGTIELIVTKASEFTVEECSVHYFPRRRKKHD
ncbi:MAG: hemolysin family protein [Bacilli bacterium]|nr:hemolysin family protein [Bacilli bacterium]